MARRVDSAGATTLRRILVPADEGRAPVRTSATRLRLNFGCGDYPLGIGLPEQDGWVNIDSSTDSRADYVVTVPPIPYENGEADEIWGCHFLEHLTREQADEFMSEAHRVLKHGGMLGLVVPDTRELAKRYIAGSQDFGALADGRTFKVADLDDLCAYWLFSTVQPSHHKWAYEFFTLQRLMETHGFTVTGEIDRFGDTRLGTGRWYQCGAQARKP